MKTQTKQVKARRWTGRILHGIISLFLLFDSVVKIIKHPEAVKGTTQLGLPESCIQPLGWYLLLCTVLFIIPRTRLLGGIFLTAYLGGAVAITYSAQQEGHPYLFAIVFAIIAWLSILLQNNQIKNALFTDKNQ